MGDPWNKVLSAFNGRRYGWTVRMGTVEDGWAIEQDYDDFPADCPTVVCKRYPHDVVDIEEVRGCGLTYVDALEAVVRVLREYAAGGRVASIATSDDAGPWWQETNWGSFSDTLASVESTLNYYVRSLADPVGLDRA